MSSASAGEGTPFGELFEIANVLAQQPRTVVRKPVAPRFFEVVVRQDDLHHRLPVIRHVMGAPWPHVERNGLARLRARLHPVRRCIGRLHSNQSLYAQPRSGAGWVYLWIMPWTDNEHATLRFGVARPSRRAKADVARLAEQLYAQHQERAQQHSGEIQREVQARTSRVVRFDPVSHYYVTPTYVGPDRRDAPTGPISRFLLRGHRQLNVTGMAKVNYYADRILPQYRRYLYGLLGLSLWDAATTLYLVFGRGFVEVNPVMRESLSLSPLVFLAVKVCVTLVFSVLILMHQHFRAFPWVLRAVIATYLVVNVRALWLMVG